MCAKSDTKTIFIAYYVGVVGKAVISPIPTIVKSAQSFSHSREVLNMVRYCTVKILFTSNPAVLPNIFGGKTSGPAVLPVEACKLAGQTSFRRAPFSQLSKGWRGNKLINF